MTFSRSSELKSLFYDIIPLQWTVNQRITVNESIKVWKHQLIFKFSEVSWAKSSHFNRNLYDWKFHMRAKVFPTQISQHAGSPRWPTEICFLQNFTIHEQFVIHELICLICEKDHLVQWKESAHLFPDSVLEFNSMN